MITENPTIELEITEQDIANALEMRAKYDAVKAANNLDGWYEKLAEFEAEHGTYSSWCVVDQAARRAFPNCQIDVSPEAVSTECDEIERTYYPVGDSAEAMLFLIEQFDSYGPSLAPAKIKLELAESDLDA